jgi:hypothetical protein
MSPGSHNRESAQKRWKWPGAGQLWASPRASLVLPLPAELAQAHDDRGPSSALGLAVSRPSSTSLRAARPGDTAQSVRSSSAEAKPGMLTRNHHRAGYPKSPISGTDLLERTYRQMQGKGCPGSPIWALFRRVLQGGKCE